MIRIFADFFNAVNHHPSKSALSVLSGFYFKFRRTHVVNVSEVLQNIAVVALGTCIPNPALEKRIVTRDEFYPKSRKKMGKTPVFFPLVKNL